jgi:hypothetical protein
METRMKRSKETLTQTPRYDYALALQNAVSWLGDRYLLAEPVAKRKEEPKPYFAVPPRWFPGSR